MLHRNKFFIVVVLRSNMKKQIVNCKHCKREIITEKSIDIQCRGCGKRFDLD